MRYMSHKIIIKTAAYLALVSLFSLTMVGCSSSPEREFKPPVYPPPPAEPRLIYERTLRSSSDIVELTAAEKLRIFATGTREGSFGLAKPYGIAVKEGRIYVSDTVQRAVLMFDAPGGKFKFIGAEGGPGALQKPLGIDTAPNGDLYVADNTGKRIVIFDKDGNYLNSFGGAADLDRPSGVAVSPDGARAYVIDTGGIESVRHRLLIYDTQTMELIKVVGRRGSGPGDFNLPLQVATAPDGTVYVVDGGNFRVQTFTQDGEFIRSTGEVGNKSGNFSRPKGIDTDNDGNFYVADAAFGNFQIFSSEGKLLLFVGSRGESGGAGQFMLPSGIEVDEDGRVYMADQFLRKIDIFRPYHLEFEDGYLGTRYKEQIQNQLESEEQ